MSKPRFESFEVGPSGAARRWLGRATYAIVFLGVAGAFVYLFFLLTLNWKIAVGSATVLIGYMLVVAWWTERNIGQRDDSMR